MKLHVAFLWHMHQPLYLDPRRGRFSMPWVRLHGLKAYHDMLTSIEEVPGARATFNLVPSLLFQIQAYLNGGTDAFLDMSRIPAGDLDGPSVDFILTHFFSCHWPTMVAPYPRYVQLLNLRGREYSPARAQDARRSFSRQDLLDLQVWFNLTWIGYTGRRDPFVQGLFQKGRLFTEEEKGKLLDFHLEYLGRLIPRYTDLWNRGHIDITTTPFYHPILPLIFDTDIAARANPGVRLPPRFSYPKDVAVQLDRARRFCSKTFGSAPTGLWPSEGSVAPEVVPFVVDAGFSWMATDESVLFSSLDHHGPECLFQPYRFEFEGKAVDMVFRHHELSDLIGFVYKGNDPHVSVSDFIGRLHEILDRTRTLLRFPFVAVILDGENPWEYYPDGGEAFLAGLYAKIDKDPDLELVTITDYLSAHPPSKTLQRLHSASWINNDFGIWIGGEEENKAWQLLGEAREAIERFRLENPGDTRADKAFEFVLAAEGSDWFWWYGDKFATDYAYEFDELFRANLQGVYIALDLPVPPALFDPVRRPRPARPAVLPLAFIHPTIDGRLSYYWEWAGAGVLPLDDKGETMHKGEGRISELAYGFDPTWLYLRIKARESFSAWNGQERLIVRLTSRDHVVSIGCGLREGDSQAWECHVTRDSEELSVMETGVRWAVGDVMEIAIPFALLAAGVHDEVMVTLEMELNGLVQDRWPSEGYISVMVPDADFEKRIWLV